MVNEATVEVLDQEMLRVVVAIRHPLVASDEPHSVIVTEANGGLTGGVVVDVVVVLLLDVADELVGVLTADTVVLFGVDPAPPAIRRPADVFDD